MTDQVTGHFDYASERDFEPITRSVRHFSPCSNAEHREYCASCLSEPPEDTAGIHERGYGSCMPLPRSAGHHEPSSSTKPDARDKQQDNRIISPRLKWYADQASYLKKLDWDKRAYARSILRRASDPLLKLEDQRRSSIRPLSLLTRRGSRHMNTKDIWMDGTSPQWPTESIKGPAVDTATTHAAVHAETTGPSHRALASSSQETPGSRSSIQVVESNNSVYEVIWDEKDFSESDPTGSEPLTAASSRKSSSGGTIAQAPFDRSRLDKMKFKLAAWAWDSETGGSTKNSAARSLSTTARSVSDTTTDLVHDGPTPTGDEPPMFCDAQPDTTKARSLERPGRSSLSNAESSKFAIHGALAHPERVFSNLATADTRFNSHRDSVAVTRVRMEHKSGMDMSRHRDSISVERVRAQDRGKAASNAVDIRAPPPQPSQILPSMLDSSPLVEGADRTDIMSDALPNESPLRPHAEKHIRIAEGDVRRRH